MCYGTREPAGFDALLVVRAVSYDEGAFEINGFEMSVFFDVQFYRFGQSVQAQTIFLLIDLGQQVTFQLLALHLIDATFEYGVLYTLADTLANFCHTAQAAAAFFGLGGYVVGNNDEHVSEPRKEDRFRFHRVCDALAVWPGSVAATR